MSMRIGLHDAELDSMKKKAFPNYALMKLSAYHKDRGDQVNWWEPGQNFDLVYSSKTFDFTSENSDLPAGTVRGGTGYRDIPIDNTLPAEIDQLFPDYSLYPECDYAIGYLTRGCPNRCPWCVVPLKEGNIHPYRDWREVIRQDSQKLTLMDNNILACDYGIEQLASLVGSGYAIDLNQGMDARLVTPEVAEILSKLKWQRYISFSCDSIGQIEAIQKVAERLGRYGVRPYRLFIYLLVRKDLANAAYRVEQLKRLKGINIYAQAEKNPRKGIMPNHLQNEFARRYIYGGCYRKETWEAYQKRKGLGNEEEIESKVAI